MCAILVSDIVDEMVVLKQYWLSQGFQGGVLSWFLRYCGGNGAPLSILFPSWGFQAECTIPVSDIVEEMVASKQCRLQAWAFEWDALSWFLNIAAEIVATNQYWLQAGASRVSVLSWFSDILDEMAAPKQYCLQARASEGVR